MASDCQHPQHDHTYDYSDGDVNRGVEPMLCQHCHLPAHYDYAIEQYVHDDSTAAPCFLIPSRHPQATPCASAETIRTLIDTGYEDVARERFGDAIVTALIRADLEADGLDADAVFAHGNGYEAPRDGDA